MERNTRQRDAILQAFEAAGRPLSPHEAHKMASRSFRGLGIATVYRNIKAFVQEAVLTVVDLPGEVARYEVAGKDHHHHFQCRRCDRVYDIRGCVGRLYNVLPKGFRVENHEVVLYGRCAACA